MSLRPSIAGSPLACSGLMYSGVPTTNPVCVIPGSSSSQQARAIPKSASSACHRPEGRAASDS